MARAGSSKTGKATEMDGLGTNTVTLVGRLAGEINEITLPSGDVLSSFRIVVPRRGAIRDGGATVDTIDCIASAAGVRKSLERRTAGDVVTVHGALRRRFFRAAGSVASRYEVAATKVTRVVADRTGRQSE